MIGNASPTLFMARPASERDLAATRLAEHKSRWTDPHNLEEWVTQHPVLCMTSALVFGVVIGWLIKRR